MKNFLIVVLMAAIVVGTGFGVKWEIDTWNEKNNPKTEEVTQNNQNQTVEDDTETTNELDLSDFE